LSRRMVAITYIVRFSWSGADIGFQAFGVVGFNTACSIFATVQYHLLSFGESLVQVGCYFHGMAADNY